VAFRLSIYSSHPERKMGAATHGGHGAVGARLPNNQKGSK
jgi:hypothetical protein